MKELAGQSLFLMVSEDVDHLGDLVDGTLDGLVSLNELSVLIVLQTSAQVLDQSEEQTEVLDSIDVVEVLIASHGRQSLNSAIVLHRVVIDPLDVLVSILNVLLLILDVLPPIGTFGRLLHS